MYKNQKNILNGFISLLVFMVFVVPFFVNAQGGGGDTPTPGGGGDTPGVPAGTDIKIKIENPFKENSIKGLIETIVNEILMQIGGVVAVMMIMYAGFMYVTARGDPGQIKKAHDALLWAVIGAAILLGAWVISQTIGTTIDQLKKP